MYIIGVIGGSETSHVPMMYDVLNAMLGSYKGQEIILRTQSGYKFGPHVKAWAAEKFAKCEEHPVVGNFIHLLNVLVALPGYQFGWDHRCDPNFITLYNVEKSWNRLPLIPPVNTTEADPIDELVYKQVYSEMMKSIDDDVLKMLVNS